MDKVQLARQTFTLEFKADVVRHRKAENLSWADADKAFDVLPKLVEAWEAQYSKGLLTGEDGRRTVSPGQARDPFDAALTPAARAVRFKNIPKDKTVQAQLRLLIA